ncbi:4-(cytidine 5'-diphospho)-2-C-methyl-D-erythritol kinase [Fusibacter sp. 3D3]|uniref:4-(cytidine 5'-diphospho)-2-C-methyl-D-erythritol kinase n=1 Tax=Fusibacter sp. 3D3 TaxID=1048380 RepID=UPI0008530E7A|nr:4-(cytidine 5'-diphospho)-2-C-methyl-D-erythritol kinase [Fusibacter sp. 3D3]GAU77836.1 4-diphosphocytidyl-2-C-methyl-D-erythritol kinase [Fusibacter sp. 3D3]
MVTLRAHAKINLTLDVIGKRDNGYHDVEMIMQQIDLYDVVTVSLIENSNEINLTCSDEFLPTDQMNIAYRAAVLMQESYNLRCGFKIHIEKNIPIAAGLAGGSTNAAAVIKAINRLCHLNLSLETMKTIGFKLGADVPFCIQGNCAIARGLGELLEPIKGLEHTFIVLIKPNFGVSTQEIYQNLNWQNIKEHPNTTAMVAALAEDNRYRVNHLLCNVLETVTFERYPKVHMLKQFVKRYGPDGILMSGSGPTIFAIYKNYDRAKHAVKSLKKHFPQTYLVMTHNVESL